MVHIWKLSPNLPAGAPYTGSILILVWQSVFENVLLQIIGVAKRYIGHTMLNIGVANGY